MGVSFLWLRSSKFFKKEYGIVNISVRDLEEGLIPHRDEVANFGQKKKMRKSVGQFMKKESERSLKCEGQLGDEVIC